MTSFGSVIYGGCAEHLSTGMATLPKSDTAANPEHGADRRGTESLHGNFQWPPAVRAQTVGVASHYLFDREVPWLN